MGDEDQKRILLLSVFPAIPERDKAQEKDTNTAPARKSFKRAYTFNEEQK